MPKPPPSSKCAAEQSSASTRSFAVVGSGPAGLMAADVLARSGERVTLFEKRKGLGRKLLIAGSSGLNITNDCPADRFHENYSGPSGHFRRLFRELPPRSWIEFIEKELGIPTFKGTSRRYFVEGMKASQLLKAWTGRLREMGVEIVQGREWKSFEETRSYTAVCLALGGGSYEPDEKPLRWVETFRKSGLRVRDFAPSNVGFEIDWPAALLKEAEGKPIKNVTLSSSRGARGGELMITRYGLEGTPIYAVGAAGTVHLDLKPDLDAKSLLERLSSGKENLSPIRRIKKYLNLGDGASALIFHLLPEEVRIDLARTAAYLKRFPLTLKSPRPLEEAISSSGGLVFDEVDGDLMLRKHPGVFVAGEMLDWDAPTGGYLIQACVSQGYLSGRAMLRYERS